MRLQGVPQYEQAVTEEPPESVVPAGGAVAASDAQDDANSLYDKAVAIVLRDRKPTISYIQRQLRIGYNRAADLIDQMEREGVVSAQNVSGKREILVPERN